MSGAWWVDIVYVRHPSMDQRTVTKGPYSSSDGANRNANSVRLLWADVADVDVRWTSEPSVLEYDSSDSWCGR